ncbi:MAG: hypothetical protein ACLUFT_06345 [Gemmiger formicilis]|uniref:hypothetical protein n=1 Tax=Gemmiger formicilis TaxID=745368 RepID=UPI0039912197
MMVAGGGAGGGGHCDGKDRLGGPKTADISELRVVAMAFAVSIDAAEVTMVSLGSLEGHAAVLNILDGGVKRSRCNSRQNRRRQTGHDILVTPNCQIGVRADKSLVTAGGQPERYFRSRIA